jgi:hypothetical protein
MLSPTKEGNTIVIAWKGDAAAPRELLQQRAEVVEARWELPATKWLRLIKPLPQPKPDAATTPPAATEPSVR